MQTEMFSNHNMEAAWTVALFSHSGLNEFSKLADDQSQGSFGSKVRVETNGWTGLIELPGSLSWLVTYELKITISIAEGDCQLH